MTDREHKIRQRAYGIWEEEGHPPGREQEHWHRAAREVESVTPTQPEFPDIGEAPSLQPAEKPAAKSRKAAAASTATPTRKRTTKKS